MSWEKGDFTNNTVLGNTVFALFPLFRLFQIVSFEHASKIEAMDMIFRHNGVQRFSFRFKWEKWEVRIMSKIWKITFIANKNGRILCAVLKNTTVLPCELFFYTTYRIIGYDFISCVLLSINTEYKMFLRFNAPKKYEKIYTRLLL